MNKFVIGVLICALAIALLIVLTAAQYYLLHALVAAGVALLIAVQAARDNRRAVVASQPRNRISALNARYMGFVWGWGAVSMAAMYMTVIAWKEWWHFVLGFAAAACLSFIFATILEGRDGNSSNDGIIKYARWLAIAQLAGMIITMLGLIIDGKMDFGYVDWAGNNVFFTSAAALAVISWEALKSDRAADGS